jgi:NitT/TauT family transport system substrate-binding protein
MRARPFFGDSPVTDDAVRDAVADDVRFHAVRALLTRLRAGFLSNVRHRHHPPPRHSPDRRRVPGTPLFALSLYAVLAVSSASPGASQTAAVLRIATVPIDNAAEVYYAKEMGFFAKAGLDVQIQGIQNSGEIGAAIASGAVDIGYGTLIPLALAHVKHIAFVIVAPATVYTSQAPNSKLIVLADSPIRNAKDLTGKVIGTNGLGNISEYGPRDWIDRTGGDSSKVRFIEMPFSAMPEALTAGRIDAAWLTEPYLDQTKGTGRVLATALDAISKEFLIGAWFTTSQWASNHPDLVRRFAAAMHDAADWANANPSKSAEILVKYTKIDPAVVARMVRSRYADRLSVALMQPVVDLAATYGKFPTFPAGELLYVPSR